jgi:cystathionine beta-lyase
MSPLKTHHRMIGHDGQGVDGKGEARGICRMAKNPGGGKPEMKADTRLVTGGRDPFSYYGFINPPVYHASTMLYPSADDLLAGRGRYQYGRRGTPTSEALEQAMAQIEGPACAGVALVPSGLAAISTTMLAAANAGDHILVTDSVYEPTRILCNTVLKRLGIETTYYDPLIGAGIAGLFKSNTRLVFLESPGSLSFEMQDVPAITAAAHAHGALVAMDNTWATPLYFPALDFGVDLSIQAGTKYIGGHADVMIGMISANDAAWPLLHKTVGTLGLCVGPDDIYLALRGLRTLGVRLGRHYESGLKIARWMQARPEVARVLYPPLDSDPGHALWQRDFSGACGLFSIVLKPVPDAAIRACLDAFKLFGLGYSWGGFESLVIPFNCTKCRTATQWAPGGPSLRFHIGLEDTGDLIADLERGFAALSAAD